MKRNWKRALCVVAAIGVLSLSESAMADEYEEAITEDEVVFVDEELYYDQVEDAALSEVVIEEELGLSDVEDSFIENDLFESNEEILPVYAEDVVASGTCGEYVTWKIMGAEGDYTIVLSGEGEMEKYWYSTVPWEIYKSEIKQVIVEEGITTLGYHVFNKCSELENVHLPDSLKEIGGEAFSNCSKLKEITLPDGIESIRSGAFAWCNLLDNVVLPSNLSIIEQGAFFDCTSLSEIIIPGKVKSVNGFSGCIHLKNVVLPEGLETIEEEAFYECSSLTSISLPKSVTAIGHIAFANCSSLMSALIPGNVSNVAEKAFDDHHPDLIIYGQINTALHDLAKRKHITFIDPNHAHSYGEWMITKDPTYTSEGIETRTCTVCDASENRSVAKLEPITNVIIQPVEKVVTQYVPAQPQTQNIVLTAKSPTVKAGKLKKKNQTLGIIKALTVANAQGLIIYRKTSGNKKVTIDPFTGKITLQKGLKKGTYKIGIQVIAIGNATYMSEMKSTVVKIKVK